MVDVVVHILHPRVKALDTHLFVLIVTEHGIHLPLHVPDPLIQLLSLVLASCLHLLNLLNQLSMVGLVLVFLAQYLFSKLLLQQLLLLLDGSELLLIPSHLPHKLLLLLCGTSCLLL